jgi:hypothetical protein
MPAGKFHAERLRPLQMSACAYTGVPYFSKQPLAYRRRGLASACDNAMSGYRTPNPYGFKLLAHVQPYLVEGAQEMIDAGHHREAMLWIAAFCCIANTAIQQRTILRFANDIVRPDCDAAGSLAGLAGARCASCRWVGPRKGGGNGLLQR